MAMLRSAGCVMLEREPNAPGSDGRRLDFAVSDLVKDVKIMADFTVAAPFAKSYVKKAAQQTGHAAATATKRKNDKYKAVCKQVKVLFKPLSCRTI